MLTALAIAIVVLFLCCLGGLASSCSNYGAGSFADGFRGALMLLLTVAVMASVGIAVQWAIGHLFFS